MLNMKTGDEVFSTEHGYGKVDHTSTTNKGSQTIYIRFKHDWPNGETTFSLPYHPRGSVSTSRTFPEIFKSHLEAAGYFGRLMEWNTKTEADDEG